MIDITDENDLFEYILEIITKKINSPEINKKIQHEIILPISNLFISHLYPYLISTIIVISLMFICILGTFILILKK